MPKVKRGDTIRVHYMGTLADGTRFDYTRPRQPQQLTVGDGWNMPGFDEALVGMEPGQVKTVTIPPEKAYGRHDAAKVLRVPRASIPADVTLERGIRLDAKLPDGRPGSFTVVEAGADTVVLDSNHPLAGRALTFEIGLVEIL